MTTARTGYNGLTLEIYQRGTTTRVEDPDGMLARAELESFETIYPGGLYGSARIRIPHDVTRSFLFKEYDRLVIRNGLSVVYEGEIGPIAYTVGADAEQSIEIEALGFWGSSLGRRTLNKPWADKRLSEDAWILNTCTPGACMWNTDEKPELFKLERNNRLMFTPEGASVVSSNFIRTTYTAPCGVTIQRIKFNFDMQETTQAWRLNLFNLTSASTMWLSASSGSGTVDYGLSAFGTSATRAAWFAFVASANQTPITGSVYGQFSDVTIYTTPCTAVNLSNIVKEARASASDIFNSDVSNVATNGLTIEPFITHGQESLTSVLTRAAAFGGSAYEAWSVGVWESDRAQTSNGLPVLYAEAQPTLDDYDYAIRVDEENLIPPFSVVRDATGVSNWISIERKDSLGHTEIITPDSVSALSDATSTSAFGRRDLVVQPDESTSGSAGTAVNYGRRALAAQKDRRFYVSGPIRARGYVRAKTGQPVPASQVRAGKRIRIENFLTDLVGVSGAGLTFLIAHTSYSDASEEVSISCGALPDDMAIYLAQAELRRG